ncbi:hypothetical protein QTP88_005931 [Uroleucon formosanum]
MNETAKLFNTAPICIAVIIILFSNMNRSDPIKNIYTFYLKINRSNTFRFINRCLRLLYYNILRLMRLVVEIDDNRSPYEGLSYNEYSTINRTTTADIGQNEGGFSATATIITNTNTNINPHPRPPLPPPPFFVP